MIGISRHFRLWAQGRRLITHPSLGVVAVVLFLVFDLSALLLNIWLTYRIETQAVGINLAGRQRMLSQQIVKSLLLTKTALDRGDRADAQLAELRGSFTLFDNTLLAFAEGGLTVDSKGQEVHLDAQTGDRARVVALAREQWAPYRSSIVELISGDTSSAALQRATLLASDLNLELLALMDRLTTELERVTQHEAAQIRFFQGLAFLLALLNFAIATIVYLLRMLSARREIDLVDSIINRVGSGILVVDDASIVIRANHATEALFGCSETELLGRHLSELVSDGLGIRRDGQAFDCELEVSSAQLEGRPVDIIALTDITERRRKQSRFAVLAYHDPLTGLPNRLLFDDRLQLELSHALRRHGQLAVLFLDLDGFKQVNDAYGHDIGDLLLRQVAGRLKRHLRATDTLSRRGGDEFTVILTEIDERTGWRRQAEALRACIAEPYYVNQVRLEVGASIGVAIYPDSGEVVEQLLRHADEALGQAKRCGPGTIRRWNEVGRDE